MFIHYPAKRLCTRVSVHLSNWTSSGLGSANIFGFVSISCLRQRCRATVDQVSAHFPVSFHHCHSGTCPSSRCNLSSSSAWHLSPSATIQSVVFYTRSYSSQWGFIHCGTITNETLHAFGGGSRHSGETQYSSCANSEAQEEADCYYSSCAGTECCACGRTSCWWRRSRGNSVMCHSVVK